MENVAAVVLAAGKGVRMESDLPKVCHELNGEPLIRHVLVSVFEAGIKDVYVVVGHKAELVKEKCADLPVTFVMQKQRLGTGHAVKQVEPHLNGKFDTVLVLNGDTPLIRSETIRNIVARHKKSKSKATLLTAQFTDPAGYGRIVRADDGAVVRTVEDNDAVPEEKDIKEINTGTYCFDKKHLFASLRKIKSENSQGEYYLTDTISLFNSKKLPVAAVIADDHSETLGINTRSDLEAASRIFSRRKVTVIKTSSKSIN